jgi:hypothetical protein
MNCTQRLPEGFREILSVDLQKDHTAAEKVRGLCLALFAALILLGLGIVPASALLEHLREPPGLPLRAGVLLAGTILYPALHELSHAAVMKAYGARKLRFGFTGAYAYAGSTEDFFGKRAHRRIALAPLALWTPVFALLCALVPRDWFWVAWFWQCLNVSGAAGDLYVTLRLRRLPEDILVRDAGVDMTVYAKQTDSAQT